MALTEQRQWRSRIVDHGEADPASLVANPLNYRRHPKFQADALGAVLDSVGVVQDVIVNRRSGRLVDGHLRVALAVERAEPSIPVVYVDLDDDEERLVLATLDPLAALAETDADALGILLASVTAVDEALRAMLDGLAATNPPTATVLPPDEFPEYGEDIETEHTCPKCGYAWSGGS